MPTFTPVEKADLAVGALDIEALAPYISALEPYFGEPDSGALVLTLESGETPREVTRNVKNAYKVLQVRNPGSDLSPDSLVVKRRGQKLAVSIERTPPVRTPRPRKASRSKSEAA